MNPVALRFELGPDEYLAQQKAQFDISARQAQSAVWKDTLLFVAACAFGLLAALKADSQLLMLLFGTAGLARLFTPWEHKAKFQAGLMAHANKRIRRRDVALHIDDDGLHEEIEGVRSFAPWPAIKSFRKVGHVLLIELAGEFKAVIPLVAFLGAGAPTEAEFIALLRSRGVSEGQ